MFKGLVGRLSKTFIIIFCGSVAEQSRRSFHKLNTFEYTLNLNDFYERHWH